MEEYNKKVDVLMMVNDDLMDRLVKLMDENKELKDKLDEKNKLIGEILEKVKNMTKYF
jgi:predicted  nucleic acid-binding Zn-ribbon protein